LHVYFQNKFGRKLGRRYNGQLRVTLIATGIDSSFDVTSDTVMPIMRFLAVAHIFSSRNISALRNGAKSRMAINIFSRVWVRENTVRQWRIFATGTINKYRYRWICTRGHDCGENYRECYRTFTLYAHNINQIRSHASWSNCITEIVRNHGWWAIYVGVTSSIPITSRKAYIITQSLNGQTDNLCSSNVWDLERWFQNLRFFFK